MPKAKKSDSEESQRIKRSSSADQGAGPRKNTQLILEEDEEANSVLIRV